MIDLSWDTPAGNVLIPVSASIATRVAAVQRLASLASTLVLLGATFLSRTEQRSRVAGYLHNTVRWRCHGALSETPAVVCYVVLCIMLDVASWLATVVIGAAGGGEVAAPAVLGSGGAA